MMIFWYLLAVALILIGLCEYYAFKVGIPTVTSYPSVRRKMIELLQKEVEQYRGVGPFTIYDLGSGTGKLALEIATALPSTRVVGVELSIVPYVIAQFRRFVRRVPNLVFKRVNFWSYDVSDAQAVTLYINARTRERMAQKLMAELPSGVLVLMNETHLPDWEPLTTYSVGLLKVKVVVYRKK